MGLKVFMRVQYLQHEPTRDMAKATIMYTELHAKAIELTMAASEMHEQYPHVSTEACERMLCLMSDIDPSMALEVKPHVWDMSGTSPSLALQVWKRDDALDKLPVFVFAESCPGSAMQDIPCVMFNISRKKAARAIWASIPENGFMKHRNPSRKMQKFQEDAFDTRTPDVDFLRMLQMYITSQSSSSTAATSTHASAQTSASTPTSPAEDDDAMQLDHMD